MTPDNWIALLAIINVLAIAVTGGIVKSHFAARAEARTAAAIAQARADEAVEKITELALRVARDYAPNGYVGAVETRLMEQLRAMNNKLDQLLLDKGHRP